MSATAPLDLRIEGGYVGKQYGGLSCTEADPARKVFEDIQSAELLLASMKSLNAAIRKAGHQIAMERVIREAGYTGWYAGELLKRRGFERAAIARVARDRRLLLSRFRSLGKAPPDPSGFRARSMSGVVYQIVNRQVQIVCPGMPPERVSRELSRKGFRYSAVSRSYQRTHNADGEQAARELITWLDNNGL